MTTATPPIPSAAYRQALMLLQRQQRAQMTTLIAQTEAAIAADWQRGGAVVAQYYAPLLDRYARALDDLRRSSDDPAAALSLDWLRGQQSTLKSIEASAARTINTTAAQSAQRITQAQSAAVQRGAGDAYALGQRALSPAFEEGYPPGVLFNRPNPDALAQWVGRAGTGHPLGDLFANFAPQAASEARKAMMLGLTMGDNPRAMARGLANALGISRSRALIISRTEVLGSYRSAAHETYRNNSDVLNGWLWSAGGQNPCAGCMGMDGLIFSLDEQLLDHPCGKCAPLPVTKPWSDILDPLGIDVGDMPETSLGTPGNYFGGEEKFAHLPPEQQRAIIGTRTGYEAYKRGEVSLRDFVGRRSDGMIYQKSLRELQIPTGRANVHNAHLVEPSPTFAKVIVGEAKLLERGARTPLEEMPAWARATPARQEAYQILRNGLPWNMAEHERPLLMMNLEEMLKEADLPLNVRLAAMRQLDVLREYETYLKNNLWNVWHTAASTLERPGEFVYSPTQRLERELAAARAAARAEGVTARDISAERALLDALRPQDIHPTTGDLFHVYHENVYKVEINGQSYLVKRERSIANELNAQAADRAAQLMQMGNNVVPARIIENDAGRFIVQPWVNGTELTETSIRNVLEALPADAVQRQSLFDYLIGDADRGPASFFLTPDRQLRAIDYGGAFDAHETGLINNLLGLGGSREREYVQIGIDRTVAEDLLSHVDAVRAMLEQSGLDAAQIAAFDERVARLEAALAHEHPAYYDLLSAEAKPYYPAPDRNALLTIGEQTAAREAAQVGEDIAYAASRATTSYYSAEGNYVLSREDQQFVADLKRQVDGLDQKALTHDQAINIGQQIHERINSEAALADFHDYSQQAWEIRVARTADLTQDQIAWVSGNPEAVAARGGVHFGEAQARYQAEFQARTLSYLQEMRQMGGADIKLNEAAEAFDARAAGELRSMQDVMPKDWIEASNNLGDLEIIKNRATNSAGWYESSVDGGGKIALSYNRNTPAGDLGLRSSALHEMMHRMENAIPQIGELERDFYNYRTAGEEFVRLTNGIGQDTKLDRWIDEYLGRQQIVNLRPEYTNAYGFQARTSLSYELLSMGAEMLLGGGGTFDLVALREDEEFVNFILGLLSTVRAEAPGVLP